MHFEWKLSIDKKAQHLFTDMRTALKYISIVCAPPNIPFESLWIYIVSISFYRNDVHSYQANNLVRRHSQIKTFFSVFHQKWFGYDEQRYKCGFTRNEMLILFYNYYCYSKKYGAGGIKECCVEYVSEIEERNSRWCRTVREGKGLQFTIAMAFDSVNRRTFFEGT